MEVIRHINKLSEERKSSFWYDGHIASIKLDNGNTLITETSGCIELSFSESSKTFKNRDAVTEAFKLGLVDTDLEDLIDSDRFSFTNWFRFVEIDGSGDTVDDDYIDIESSYDDAIAILISLSEDSNVMWDKTLKRCED